MVWDLGQREADRRRRLALWLLEITGGALGNGMSHITQTRKASIADPRDGPIHQAERLPDFYGIPVTQERCAGPQSGRLATATMGAFSR